MSQGRLLLTCCDSIVLVRGTVRSDGVVKDALNSYFLKNNKQQGGAWYFLTRAGQQDITMIGKTEKSILETKSSLPFMK